MGRHDEKISLPFSRAASRSALRVTRLAALLGLYATLRRRYMDHDRAGDTEDITVTWLCADLLDRPTIDPAADHHAIGARSLTLIVLADRLRDELGVQIDLMTLIEPPSIDNIASNATPYPDRPASRPARPLEDA